MNFYLLFKSLHLIAVISWMAGLLYLPRIFVYHSEAKDDSQRETRDVAWEIDELAKERFPVSWEALRTN